MKRTARCDEARRLGGDCLRMGSAEVFLFGVTHWHPACAWRILRALEELRPDGVAVEIPTGLEPVVNEALAVVFPRELGCAVAWECGNDRPDGWEALVLSAGDAITHACLWAMRNRVNWVGIDLARRMNAHEPEPCPSRFPDPWAGQLDGDEYARVLDACLADEPVRPADHLRELHMAAMIRQQMGACRRVVAVVGAAHRERVRAAILAPPTTRETPPPANAEVARLDAVSLQARFLGPLPQLSLRLHAIATDPARLGTFDPRREVEELVHRAVGDYRTLRGQQPGAGQLDRFWRTVWKPILSDCRVLPGVIDLCRAAASAVDEDFAILVGRRCFGMLGPAPSYPNRYRVLRTPNADTEYMAPEWWLTGLWI